MPDRSLGLAIRYALSVGKYNSSETRVRPFFRTLLGRDPVGVTWLPKLLQIAPRRNLYPHPDLLRDPGHILEFQPTLVADKERPLPPSDEFLRWLILHPQQMSWPNCGRARFGPETQKLREQLMGRRDLTNEPKDRRDGIRISERDQAMNLALRELERLGAASSRRCWWAFEGFTFIDFFIDTDRLRIYFEGKRTELLSPSTDWYPKRNQLLRNLESAQADAGGAPFVCVVVAEDLLPDIDSVNVEESLPHLEPEARQLLVQRYAGTITWRQACQATGIDYALLPESV